MKKIILASIMSIFCVTVFHSCKDDNTVVIDREEYEKLKGTPKPEYPKPFQLLNELNLDNYVDGILMGTDNHEYLVTKHNGNSESVSHYVDCKECINRNSLIQRNQ